MSSASSPTVTSASQPSATSSDLGQAQLKAISAARIFFGHRSVGANILEMGVSKIYRDAGVNRPSAATDLSASRGALVETWLDQTDDPQSKLDDFDNWMRNKGMGARADVAFMKLGYVDILEKTDVARLFQNYKKMMDELQEDFPNVRFLHVTVSVTRWQPGDNAAIERFNELMRAAYGQTGRLFDLAGVLSTCSDGSRDEGRTDSGQQYFMLCEEYSADGGHLNELGATVAATDMLRVLAHAVAEQ